MPEGFVLMAPHRSSRPDDARPLVARQAPAADGPGDTPRATMSRRRAWPRSSAGGSAARPWSGSVQPLVGGIYTADPDDLSLKATLPQFLAMEREHGSLIRRPGGSRPRNVRTGSRTPGSGARYGMFVTLADGMDMLPQVAGRRAPAGHGPDETARAADQPPRRSRRWLVELLTARPSRPTPWSSRPRPTRRPG